MRFLFFVILGAVWSSAFAQEPSKKSLFIDVKPQVMVIVQKHRLGPDLIEMTFLDPKYPPEVLRSQIAAFGKEINSEPRAVQVFAYRITDETPAVVKATFTVDGIIAANRSQVRLEPFLRALAGAPEPYTLHGIDVLYRDVVPSKQVLQRYFPSDGTVELEAMAPGNPPGVEYRIRLGTQNPEAIKLPGESAPAQLPSEHTPQPKSGVDWPVFGVVAIGAFAAGALVYSALLRSRPKSGTQTPTNKRS